MKSFSLDINEIIRICRQNDATLVGMFGSAARGDANSQSDIDLLVRFSKQKSLLDLVRIEREISERLGKKIDLVTEQALSPYLRDSILKELRIIYEA